MQDDDTLHRHLVSESRLKKEEKVMSQGSVALPQKDHHLSSQDMMTVQANVHSHKLLLKMSSDGGPILNHNDSSSSDEEDSSGEPGQTQYAGLKHHVIGSSGEKLISAVGEDADDEDAKEDMRMFNEQI